MPEAAPIRDGTRRPASTPASRTRSTRARPTVPPVLVRQVRGTVVESQHRGDVVEVDVEGRLIRALGDPDRVVTLRSTVKPFGLAALVEAGGIDAFDLTDEELALLASSHSGEDRHVRTLHALYRRAGLTQALLACGAEGMPLDALTAARLARDGEHAGAVRHMCSGQHSAFLLLAKLRGWPLETYWQVDHPAQIAYRQALARAYGTTPDRLMVSIDSCAVPTYAFPLRDVARAYAFLADPTAVGPRDPRTSIAPALVRIRDAMLAHPEMVAGTRDRLDTSLMRAVPGRVVSKAGMEALRGVAILAGPRAGTSRTAASGLAIKIEDGDANRRATWAATIEALAQVGVLEGQPLRVLGRYHRPASLDSRGRLVAEAVADFDLAPVGELV